MPNEAIVVTKWITVCHDYSIVHCTTVSAEIKSVCGEFGIDLVKTELKGLTTPVMLSVVPVQHVLFFAYRY